MTLQEYADLLLTDQYKQPLTTVKQACWSNGWGFEEHPKCCGQECERMGWLGGAYHVECKSCGRFISDVTGPQFVATGAVSLIDHDKFPKDTDWSATWIYGRRGAP